MTFNLRSGWNRHKGSMVKDHITHRVRLKQTDDIINMYLTINQYCTIIVEITKHFYPPPKRIWKLEELVFFYPNTFIGTHDFKFYFRKWYCPHKRNNFNKNQRTLQQLLKKCHQLQTYVLFNGMIPHSMIYLSEICGFWSNKTVSSSESVETMSGYFSVKWWKVSCL